MNSRLIVVGLLIVASLTILALLMTPVVHVPYIVVHGPMSALRAQRAAALFNALIGASAFFVGLLFVVQELRTTSRVGSTTLELPGSLHLSCSLRC
ncbi:MAG TPA: hypothetical protein VNX88_09705 [Terriglobales bacterium]|jgi:hypothetical protein|nr:hypothetical protein [Terriglobales bacterium]